MDTLKVMLDLETLSLKPNARILSIGACTFDTSDEVQDVFYEKLDQTEDLIEGAFDVSSSTLNWWSQQDEHIRAEAFSGTTKITNAMLSFNNWLQAVKADHGAKNIAIYSNGAVFDIPVIKNAFDYCSITPPWSFKNELCYRTLCTLFPEQYAQAVVGVVNLSKHDALSDAKYQATVLTNLLNVLREEGINCG